MNLADLFTGGKSSAAEDAIASQLAKLNAVNAPTAAQLTLPQLEKFVSAGILTPEQAQAYLAEGNAFDTTSANNTGMEAELSTLGELRNLVNKGGVDAQGEADIQKILNTMSTSNSGNNAAILRDAAAKGTSNSGFTLASRLASNQNDATTANSNALDVAAANEARRTDALKSAGELGGQVQGQQYKQEENKANAANAIAQFNAKQKQETENLNTTAANTAETANLGNAQDISNKNTLTSQTQQASIPAAQQAAFDNELKKAGAGMEGAKALADAKQQSGQQSAGILGGLLGTAGTAATAYMTGNPYAALATALATKDKTPNTSVATAAHGGEVGPGGVTPPINMEGGGEVPGEAMVAGDHPKNDTQLIAASPDEIVLPRSVSVPAMQGDISKVIQFLRSLPKPQAKATIHPKAVLDTLRGLSMHHQGAV